MPITKEIIRQLRDDIQGIDSLITSMTYIGTETEVRNLNFLFAKKIVLRRFLEILGADINHNEQRKYVESQVDEALEQFKK